jgi:hypothetical protein
MHRLEEDSVGGMRTARRSLVPCGAIAGAMFAASTRRARAPRMWVQPHTGDAAGQEPRERCVGELDDVEHTVGSHRSIASRNAQCVLTWVTAIEPFVSIIVIRGAPHSSAIISVCLTNRGSESCVASCSSAS